MNTYNEVDYLTSHTLCHQAFLLRISKEQFFPES